MQGDWITMSTLGNFGGVVFVVTLICQFIKGPLDLMTKMRTRNVVLVISWLVLFGRRYAAGEMTVDGAFIDLLNGFLVALTAMGAHSVAQEKLDWK